jgi:hypothetical protein
MGHAKDLAYRTHTSFSHLYSGRMSDSSSAGIGGSKKLPFALQKLQKQQQKEAERARTTTEDTSSPSSAVPSALASASVLSSIVGGGSDENEERKVQKKRKRSSSSSDAPTNNINTNIPSSLPALSSLSSLSYNNHHGDTHHHDTGNDSEAPTNDFVTMRRDNIVVGWLVLVLVYRDARRQSRKWWKESN